MMRLKEIKSKQKAIQANIRRFKIFPWSFIQTEQSW